MCGAQSHTFAPKVRSARLANANGVFKAGWRNLGIRERRRGRDLLKHRGIVFGGLNSFCKLRYLE